MKADSKSPHVVSSALNVLEALRVIAEAEAPMTLPAMAARLGTSEPTAYRIMQTLKETGFARTAAHGLAGYQPTLELVRLGGLITARDPLSGICEEVLRPVSARFDEPITVGVPDGDHILFVLKFAGPRAPRFYCDVGKRLPLHAGAAARCLLAMLPQAEFDSYLSLNLESKTPATHISASQLRADRQQIRADGYASSVDEVDRGISAIGVPILNAGGRALCAAAIANVTARWGDADISARTKDMLRAAQEIRLRVSDIRLTIGG